MTEPQDPRAERETPPPTSIVVPGRPVPDEGMTDDELLDEAQQVRDLGSASRSCVAILATLLIVALAICVFLMWAFFIK
jgi:hypothetical protein